MGEAIRRHGHETRSPADIDLSPDAPPAEVLASARKHQLELITPDAALSTSPYEERFAFDRCIVFLHVSQGDVEQDDAVDRLFKRYKRLTPGRLYTVTESRVKIRQLPGRG